MSVNYKLRDLGALGPVSSFSRVTLLAPLWNNSMVTEKFPSRLVFLEPARF